MNKCSASIADDSPALNQHRFSVSCLLGCQTGRETPPGKYKMTNGNLNAEIATCVIAGLSSSPRGQSRIWKGHIVIASDRFLILPSGRRHATRRAPKRVKGKAALWVKIG